VSDEPSLPDRLRSLHPGHKLVLVAVVMFILFVGASWAIAPPQEPGIGTGPGVEDPGNFSQYGERGTLIGLQGPFPRSGGYARLITDNHFRQWQSQESFANFDATPLTGGRVLTAFVEQSPDRTGFRIYDVRNDTVEREWTFSIDGTTNSEVHDAEMLPNGEVLVVDMVRERLIAVEESGDDTWQWNASERYTAPDDPASQDWLHMNDVDRIGEDRYLVSVRNANQLLILERGEGVVEVINEDVGSSETSCLENTRGQRDRLVPDDDGEVICGNPDVIREQHNPQWIGDGRVLVADSDNNRVTELRREDGRWRPVVNYTGANGVAFNWPRDADLLENGNILVTDTLNARIVEITREGEFVWGVSTGEATNPYEADRLPHGEYPPGVLNGSVSNGTFTDEGPTRTEIPVLTLLFDTLIGTFGAIPYWANQWHLLAFLLTVSVSGIGAVWGYWDGR